MITKTGINVRPHGQAVSPMTFEEDGQVASVTATDLLPETEYDVEAYVIDNGVTIYSEPYTFTTLQAGTITVYGQQGTWGTQTKQLSFSCNWQTGYEIPDSAENFRIVTSSTSDFSQSTTVNADSYTRNAYGLSGTISATLTTNIPFGGGNTYYIKVQLVDIYGEVLDSATMTFTTPTQQAGYMIYSIHMQGTYNSWIFTNIYGFTYAPKYKYVLTSDDGWVTEKRSSYLVSNEIFYWFDPNNWSVTLEVEDIYGNRFRSDVYSRVDIVKPELGLLDNHNGSMEAYIYVNPHLNYTTAKLGYRSSGGGQTIGEVDLLPVTQDQIRMAIPLSDGTYEGEIKIVYDGGQMEQSETKTVTLENHGNIEVTDTSSIQDGILSFSADYTSYYPLVRGTVMVFDNDEDFNYIGESELTISGTTTGRIVADDQIRGIPADGCYVWITMDNDHGYQNDAELAITP